MGTDCVDQSRDFASFLETIFQPTQDRFRRVQIIRISLHDT
jgi:hypothetical protein